MRNKFLSSQADVLQGRLSDVRIAGLHCVRRNAGPLSREGKLREPSIAALVRHTILSIIRAAH